MRKLFFCAFALAFFFNSSFSQSTFGFNLSAFVPSGELKRDSPEIWGAGFNMDVAIQLNESPIHVGGIFGWTRYGSELRKGYHGPDLGDIRVRRNNDLATLLGLIRIKPPVSGNFQPYADFLGGFSYIYTIAHFRDKPFEEAWDNVRDYDDFVLNYGMGAGLEVFLNDYLSIDLSAKLIKSGRAQYLTPESVSYDRDLQAYDMTVRESRFDHLNVSIGIKVLLSDLDLY